MIDLLYQDGRICFGLDNRPMSERNIKVHKGVDQLVYFRVYDTDRRKVKVDDLSIVATIINPSTKERMLTKPVYTENDKSILSLVLTEADLVNVPVGYYTVNITVQEQLIPGNTAYVINRPFYTNTMADVSLTLIITDDVEKMPVESHIITINDWYRKTILTQDQYYTRNIYPANKIKNYKNGVHTFSVKATNYTGSLYAQGSLMVNPGDNDNSYFYIDITPFGENGSVTFNGFTGIDAFTFKANVSWIRFMHIPDINNMGTIDKIIFRS
jgi:hypothetical protein